MSKNRHEGFAHPLEGHRLAIEMVDERRTCGRKHPAHQARDGAEEQERCGGGFLAQELGPQRQLQARHHDDDAEDEPQDVGPGVRQPLEEGVASKQHRDARCHDEPEFAPCDVAPPLEEHLERVDEGERADKDGGVRKREQARERNSPHGDQPEGKSRQGLGIGGNSCEQQKTHQLDRRHAPPIGQLAQGPVDPGPVRWKKGPVRPEVHGHRNGVSAP